MSNRTRGTLRTTCPRLAALALPVVQMPAAHQARHASRAQRTRLFPSLMSAAYAIVGVAGGIGGRDAGAQAPAALASAPVRTTGFGSSPSTYSVAVGELATYDVELRGRRVGRGSLEVVRDDSVGGQNTVHASLKVRGGLLFAKVDDQFDSWFEPDRFVSRRFVQNQKEVGHRRERRYEIAPEEGTYVETLSGRVASLSTPEPLDDVSFLFFVRSLPLRVGDVDTIPRYFKSGRDVIIRVVGKKTITVPAGRFETIVVQPTITNAGGLFGQGGNAEVYFTDDSARTLVMLRSRLPVLGSLDLMLRELQAR